MPTSFISLKLKVLGLGVAALVGGMAFLGSATTANASFVCSVAAPMPGQGECWNELDVAGNAAGDFRNDGGWEARFTTFDGPPAGSDGDWTRFNFTTTNLLASQFSTQKAFGAQSAANVKTVLEGADWFGQPLTLVEQGNISGKGVSGMVNGNVLYIHVGGFSMAWLYDEDNPFFWVGTEFGKGLSNFRIYQTVSAVPLPAALPMFGAALLGIGYLSRRRKKMAEQEA